MTDNIFSLTKRRQVLVQLFYRYLLMEKPLTFIQQDLLDESQIVLDQQTFIFANQIAEQLPNLKMKVEHHLAENWKWSRLPSLVQALLIVGTFEITNTETPKPVTLNEITTLAKSYGLEKHYKFINALLEKIEKN